MSEPDRVRAAGGQSAAAPTRREFIANAILSIGVVFGLGGLAFRLAQFLYPVVPAVKLVKIVVAKLEEVPQDGAKLFSPRYGPVILERLGAEVRAFSAICTHLGCTVLWRPEPKQFYCPCHGGIYNFGGAVVSGPPPRPLENFKASVENGNVFVWMKVRQKESG